MHSPTTGLTPATAVGQTNSVQPFHSARPSGALNDLGPMQPASQESLDAIQRFNQAIHRLATVPCPLPQNFTYGNIRDLLHAQPGAMIAFVNEHNQITDMFRLDPGGRLIHTTPCGMNDASERTIHDLNSIDSRLTYLRGRKEPAVAMNTGQDVPLDDFEPTVHTPMVNAQRQSPTGARQQQSHGVASTGDSRYLSQPLQPGGAVVHQIHNGAATFGPTSAQRQAEMQRQAAAFQRQAALQRQAFEPYCKSQNAVHDFCKNALTKPNLLGKLRPPQLRILSDDWNQAMQAYGATAFTGDHPTKSNLRLAIQNASRADLEEYRDNLADNLEALRQKIEDIRENHSKNYIEGGKLAPPDEVNMANMLCDWSNQLAKLGRDIDDQLSQKVVKPSLWDRFVSVFS
ncbi:MAG: hypothetical protein Q7T63_12620 [Burkholderiaceae bacterium]|nr:hypothetical protein [Burkholderiaceae bacterium]